MAKIDEYLESLTLEQMTSYSPELFGLRKDQYNIGSFNEFKEAINRVYSDAASVKTTGPYNALCLAATLDPTGGDPDEVGFYARLSGIGGGGLIRVIARIPEIHASIPKPILGPEGLECAELRNLAIMMHPVFTAHEGSVPLPKPGNIIKVDIHPGAQHGIYLGIVDPTQEAEVTEEEGAKATVENNPSDGTVGEAEEEEAAAETEEVC